MTIERYSVGFHRGGSVSAGEAYAEMLASAGSPVSVKSITVTTGSNAGPNVALVRTFGIGTGAATGIFTGVAHRTIATQPTGPARAQIAWTSSGVTPTGYSTKLREEQMPLATGATKTLWDSHRDGALVIEPSASLLFINGGSGFVGSGGDAALKFNITWEEGRL
jgi:hypothetical protein